jgi:hypothetical protein
MKTELDIVLSAFRELRTSHPASPLGARDIIFFLVQPPYGIAWSAEIFVHPDQEDVYTVAVSTWDRLDDFPDYGLLSESGHAVGSPEYAAMHQSMLADKPTIVRSQHTIPRARVEVFLTAFSQHSFSFCPVDVTLFEVEQIEFRVGNASTSLAISWWGSGPSQWSAAIAEIRAFIAEIHAMVWPNHPAGDPGQVQDVGEVKFDAND